MESGHSPVISVRGDRVGLGPQRREDLPLYALWLNDLEVTRNLAAGMRPRTLESEQDWYERAWRDESSVHFAIYELADERPIGVTSLMGIDFAHRNAQFGILIGERDCRGRGLGTEVTHLVLDYAFTCLDLHNIQLQVYSFNPAGIRAYEKAGFKEIGRRRESVRIGGRAYDEVYMDCLPTDLQNSRLKHLLP